MAALGLAASIILTAAVSPVVCAQAPAILPAASPVGTPPLWRYEGSWGTEPEGLPIVSDPLVGRLPPVLADRGGATLERPSAGVLRAGADGVRRHRQGFFQRFEFAGNWTGGTGDDGLGISSLETSLTLAIPLGSFENLLLITPGLEVGYLDGPSQADVPPRLYDAGMSLMWRKKISERLSGMVAVRPAVASDFQTTEDAFRVTGRALATWEWAPDRLSLVFGVVYLDRNDLPVLPGAGLIWTPTPDWRLDLIFPRPRLARRLVLLAGQREDWAYLGGSLGGRTWAVERRSGNPDQLTLRDYRVYLGWERVRDGGSGAFLEAGYVFGRELEYEADPLILPLADAFMIRSGLRY